MTSAAVDPIVMLSNDLRTWFGLTGGTHDFGYGAGPVPVPNIASILSAAGITPPVVGTSGWKQREQQLNQSKGPGNRANRILLIPGNERGEEGDFVQAKHRTSNPRRLWTWERIVTASIWQVDSSDRANEELQLNASFLLLVLFTQGMQFLRSADYVYRSAHRDPVMSANVQFGRELLVEFIHRQPLNDMPQTVVEGGLPTVLRNPPS
jgi:hypothetical protein